jgi:membrane protease subunit (stomatin/prohibitin family)
MATGVNHQQGSLEGPSHNYPSPGEAHGSHAAYYDHPGQRAFEDDEDMQMANNLSQGMQNNIGAQLANAAAMSNGHGHDQEMGLSPSGVGAPGMAPPPQTPTQASVAAPHAQQSGTENTQDQGAATDSMRRKRSKVSRACDECRRKKVAERYALLCYYGLSDFVLPRFDAMRQLRTEA